MFSNRALCIISSLVPLASIMRRSAISSPRELLPELIFRALPLTLLFFWISSVVPFAGIWIYLLIFLPLAAFHYTSDFGVLERGQKAAIYLWFFGVIAIGVGGIWGFIDQMFLADLATTSIGSRPDGPFQTGLAFAHLGFGVIGLSTIWLRGIYIVGLVVASSTFWLGAALGHILDIDQSAGFSLLDVGLPLVRDMLLPMILIPLLLLSRQANR